MKIPKVMQSLGTGLVFLVLPETMLSGTDDILPEDTKITQSQSEVNDQKSQFALQKQFNFSRSNINQKILEELSSLSKDSEFFQQVLSAVKKKGYEFVLYDKDNLDIPEEVHEVMEKEDCGAQVWKNLKKVYIIGEKSNSLKAVLANEGVHIILEPPKVDFTDNDSEELSRREFTKREIQLMKESNDYTVAEKIFHLVIKEEILSQVVEDIVEEKTDSKISKKELLKGKYNARLLQLKYDLSIPVMARIIDFSEVEEKDHVLVLTRINRYFETKDIDNYVIQHLKEFKMLLD